MSPGPYSKGTQGSDVSLIFSLRTEKLIITIILISMKTVEFRIVLLKYGILVFINAYFNHRNVWPDTFSLLKFAYIININYD